MDFEIKENTNVIIVTGVAGFIGFSLTLCLLKQGVTVTGIVHRIMTMKEERANTNGNT